MGWVMPPHEQTGIGDQLMLLPDPRRPTDPDALRPQGVTVRVTFDAETTYPVEQQRDGWQAILNRFARHVEMLQRAA